MKIIYSITLLIITSVWMFSCKPEEAKETGVNNKKDSLVDKINSPELKAINAELIKEPDNAALYDKRAKVYIILKMYDEAVGDALRATKIDSTKAEYYVTLADVYFAFNKTLVTFSSP